MTQNIVQRQEQKQKHKKIKHYGWISDRKGGTVVPPSNFQFVTTESPVCRAIFEKFTHPRGNTRAQTQHPKK